MQRMLSKWSLFMLPFFGMRFPMARIESETKKESWREEWNVSNHFGVIRWYDPQGNHYGYLVHWRKEEKHSEVYIGNKKKDEQKKTHAKNVRERTKVIFFSYLFQYSFHIPGWLAFSYWLPNTSPTFRYKSILKCTPPTYKDFSRDLGI